MKKQSVRERLHALILKRDWPYRPVADIKLMMQCYKMGWRDAKQSGKGGKR